MGHFEKKFLKSLNEIESKFRLSKSSLNSRPKNTNNTNSKRYERRQNNYFENPGYGKN